MDLLTIPPFMLPLVVTFLAFTITLLYGCREDIRERAVPVVMWYPAIIISVPLIIWFWYDLISAGYLSYMIPLIPLIIFFTVSFYLFTHFHLVGMADAKALIFITVFIPCFPFIPMGGYPPFGFDPFVFLPFSVLFNAVVINLVIPVGLFFINIVRGNTAPLPYLFLGYPVSGETIEDQFGIVMEEFSEEDGVFKRRFIPIGAAIRDLVSGGKRVYTKNLKENPKQYRKELETYRRAGKVWISYGVPFLIPITGGLISAVFIGDIFSLLLKAAL